MGKERELLLLQQMKRFPGKLKWKRKTNIFKHDYFRNDYETFRETKLYWGKTVAVGSSSKLADGATATILSNQTGLK